MGLLGLLLPGSSPLARGLPPCPRVRHSPSRIIPARAGFTWVRYGPTTRFQDHPRSRGVYEYRVGAGEWRAGSSPLARGLPAGHGQPAHVIEDHPRSRGVYALRGWRAGAVAGSSPLARGLPGFFSFFVVFVRIIPARAGFTSFCSFVSSRVWDHPRSRGVYRPVPLARPFQAGSSPLARGLLDLLPERILHRGIIPARAGFTPLPSPGWVWVVGSSPLARGLQFTFCAD